MSEDEQVTSDLVRSVRGEEGAVVVQVADAKNLRRALLLTLQLGQLEVPTVLVLNMHDEAEARGIKVDLLGLEAALGVPVRTTVATRGLGLEGVLRALASARAPRNHIPMPADLASPALALLTGGQAPAGSPPAVLARYHEALLEHAGAIARAHASEGGSHRALVSRRLGRVAIHPVWGWPILAAVLWALYRVRGPVRGGDARRPRGGRPLPRLPEPLGDRALLPPAVGLRARPVRGRVRPHHHGAVLRPRHRPADRGDLLHRLRRCSRTRATCRGSRS